MSMISQFRITEPGSGEYLIHAECVECSMKQDIRVTGPELFKYNQGALIQSAFPNLTGDQREMLISGLCSICYDSLLGGWL